MRAEICFKKLSALFAVDAEKGVRYEGGKAKRP